MNTDCKKCGTPMPMPPKGQNANPIYGGSFLVTKYLCRVCGHWNDLTRRNGFMEYKNKFKNDL
jgi:hypothetical protein